jgi:outer membrane protein OmpA-like peptidoglycan-associated protein
MKSRRGVAGVSVLLASLATLVLTCGVAAAQSAQLQGLITGRSGATMTVQSQAQGKVVVVLTPATQVEEAQGVLHFRKKQLGMAALIPGLPVQVQGAYNAQNQLVADTVKFKGGELKNAQDIQAGVAPVEQQTQQQKQELAAQQAQLQQQQAQLQEQQQQQAADDAKIAANKAAIAAANKRFGELADYNILGEVTVYFANGSTVIESQYKPQLLKLAQQAQSINAYIIQVQGYASAVGSAALNQKLSSERADHVLEFMEQQGGIPLTNVLAPGAMGTSNQVAPDSTVEGQAANRRVVVRILQNKGISGT